MDFILKPFKKLLIRAHDRYVSFVTTYPGFPCSVIDKSSFLSMYHEIFERNIYRFNAKTASPKIIDCGANIGLSVIYFKKLYPNATVIAFEPDPKVYEALEKNVAATKLSGVTLIKKGLGKTEGVTSFFSEGADGGRLVTADDTKSIISIDITRLSPYLREPVDFLKIDIEGSELEVLEETKDFLKNVEHLFVEYHSLAAKPQELDKILAIISKAGFRYYVQNTGVQSDNIFIKKNTHLGYDLQLNIFASRISSKS